MMMKIGEGGNENKCSPKALFFPPSKYINCVLLLKDVASANICCFLNLKIYYEDCFEKFMHMYFLGDFFTLIIYTHNHPSQFFANNISWSKKVLLLILHRVCIKIE